MSLYTVEQVELMRRLRLTGITPQQIIDAFETLDRIERELAPYQNHIPPITDTPNPVPLQPEFTPPPLLLGSNHITAIKTFASPYDSLLNRYQRSQTGTPVSSSQHHSSSSNGQSSRRKRSIPIDTQFPTFNQSGQEAGLETENTSLIEPKDQQNAEAPVWTINPELIDSRMENVTPGDTSFKSMPELEVLETERIHQPVHEKPWSSGAPKLVRRRRESKPRTAAPKPSIPYVMPDYSQYVDEQQLEEFVSRGEVEALRDIKELVAARQLRQQTIALMTGVSQPYVSRFLSGTGKELSSRVRRVMYRWYLALKNNPDMTTPQDITPTIASSTDDSGPPTMVSVANNSIFPAIETLHMEPERSPYAEAMYSTPNGSAHSMVRHSSQSSSPGKEAQKRERFIFKPVHVRLLQKYFAMDPYPNIRKREEIAAACNKAYESMDGGKYVPPRELVNSQVVGNWFSNRRKEKKRRGEMKLRRIRGGPRFGGIRRAEHRPLPATATATAIYHVKESTSNGFILSNRPPAPANRADSLPKRERSGLDNIVNGLHAMSASSMFASMNPFGPGETSASELRG